MQPGGGYDLGLAVSGSSSATSGIGPSTQGDNVAGGGLKLPEWLLFAFLGSAVIVSVVALVLFARR